eukprot:NODE_9677_length_573_cov_18.655556_g9040_i0.p1 GENE.NODE_9677_length_573_cov_18.655556_g9040_i0~~NODE_9677_length_573_cov_18.655556_g9040_i0.p1  ORF type:complete len:141 (+),score=39.13 NODE_9677_length_573_cov_18.655556_g9040_i0:57-479(+)
MSCRRCGPSKVMTTTCPTCHGPLEFGDPNPYSAHPVQYPQQIPVPSSWSQQPTGPSWSQQQSAQPSWSQQQFSQPSWSQQQQQEQSTSWSQHAQQFPLDYSYNQQQVSSGGGHKTCPATMGGRCHYDESGRCRQCRGQRQ